MTLINPLQDASAYIYHYTSCDIALNHILKNNSLKFNSFNLVNDPRENKSWYISAKVPGNLRLELKEYDAISENISYILKSNAKLLCFSTDKSVTENAWQPEALLNRGFTKPSMWHHYANKHNGVCLMFEKKKLVGIFKEQIKNQLLFHGVVSYSNDGIMPNINNDPFIVDLILANNTQNYLSAIKNHFELWYKQLYMRKLLDWSNEDEYRWVCLDNHSEPRYLQFGSALKAIIIGENVHKSKLDEFLYHGVIHEADVANLTWHNGYPKTGLYQPYITHRHLVNNNP